MPAHAQSTADAASALEEVVVTAERRESDVQKTGLSVSVIQGDDLRHEGKFTLQQILEGIPGIFAAVPVTATMRSGMDMSAGAIAIRGVIPNGAPGGAIVQSVPTTAAYVDGVYEGVGGGYDIDRVEVLRGPQGTLYGRSATSGVVATYTRNPQLGSFSSDVGVELGNYSLQHYTGALNLPVGEQLAFRVAASQYERDGYDSAAGGAVETTDARIKMLYEPTDDLSLLVGASLQDNQTHSGGVVTNLTAPGRYVNVAAPVYSGTNNFRQVWADFAWDLGPATLTYLPSYRTWEWDVDLYSVGPGGNALLTPIRVPTDNFVTHELRLASNPDSKLTWQAGGFYYNSEMKNGTKNVTYLSSGALGFGVVIPSKETKDVGFFAEATYPLTDALRFTGGLRYDETYVQTNETYVSNLNRGGQGTPNAGRPENLLTRTVGGEAGTRRFYNFTYKARMEFDLTPQNLLYGMISTGFLPGDVQVSTLVNGIPDVVPYDEETLVAYEIGSKNRFLDNRLQLNADVFSYRYGGYQTTVIPDPTNPGSQQLVAVPLRVLGGELELAYRFTANDLATLSYGYTNAKFREKPPGFAASVVQSHLWGTIPHTAQASLSHTFHLPGDSTFTLSGTGRFLSEHDLGNVSQQVFNIGGYAYQRVEDAFVADVNGTWTDASDRFSVTGYVRNVGDERYLTAVALQSSSLPLSVSGLRSDPRTYGVILSVHF